MWVKNTRHKADSLDRNQDRSFDFTVLPLQIVGNLY